MSIKDELKEIFQTSTGKRPCEEEKLKLEAKEIISEFIIPKFKKISEIYPTSSFLFIKFHHNMGCWCYTSNIDSWEDRKNSPYDYSTVSMAVKIAKDFDIDAEKYDDGSGGETLCFSLDLR